MAYSRKQVSSLSNFMDVPEMLEKRMKFINRWIKRAKSYAPAHVADAIYLEGVKKEKGKITVTVGIDPSRQDPKHQDARAYEYGSGTKARRGALSPNQAPIKEGKKQPITITAKNGPYLIFYWKEMKRWVSTPQVSHPGVAPKPQGGYLATARKEVMNELKKELGRVAARAILTDAKMLVQGASRR